MCTCSRVAWGEGASGGAPEGCAHAAERPGGRGPVDEPLRGVGVQQSGLGSGVTQRRSSGC